ncbi:deoxyribose-phosphate aldolase [Myxococcota bacterium]
MTALAQAIEHTLLKASATPADVEQLCSEALEHGFCAVCVNLLHVARASASTTDSGTLVVCPVGFPLGATLPSVMAWEAEQALAHGAREIDMVIPLGLALAGELSAVTGAVALVRRAVGSAALKVILETGLFDGSTLASVATAALAGEPDFLKTSTGYGPRGASVEDVRSLTQQAAGRAQVKASGGIRTAAQASQLLAAGATRLGTSASVSIVTEGLG